MRRARSFLHAYTEAGMEDVDFDESAESVRNLMDEYQVYEYAPATATAAEEEEEEEEEEGGASQLVAAGAAAA